MKLLLVVCLLTATNQATAQEYLGCFVDGIDYRVLEIVKALDTNSLTIQKCIIECMRISKTYAGVEFGRECHCGDNVNHTQNGPKKDDRECNMTCTGDWSQNCGGSNRINIYSVCNRGRYKNNAVDCDYRCHCRSEEICRYSDGRCSDGCSSGWTGDSCQFVDCGVDNGRCDTFNQTCEPIKRQNACACSDGFEEVGSLCTDINECKTNQDRCSQKCHNTLGSYTCSCYPGYKLVVTEMFQCTDMEECTDGTHRCSDVCHNTPGSYYCTCHAGRHLAEDELYKCSDVDECANNQHNCSQNCTNTPGSFNCTCWSGYHQEVVGREPCVDYDECDLEANECSQICTNTEGSYRCWCEAGYYLPHGELYICSEAQVGVHPSTLVAGIVIPILVIIIIIILVRRRRTEHMSHSNDAVHSSTALKDLAADEKNTCYENMGDSSTYEELEVATTSSPHSVCDVAGP